MKESAARPRFSEISSWSTVGLVVEDVHAPGGLRLRGHGHDEPHLCYLEDGSFEEREPQGTRVLERGMMRVSPAGDEHDLTFGRAGGRCTLVFLRGELADGTSPVPRERRFIQDRKAGAIAGRLRKELGEPGRSGSPLVTEMLVLELLARTTGDGRMGSRTGSPPQWLEHARQRIAEPAETGHPIAEIARSAGCHPVHLARTFRSWYGMGPMQFARTLRLDRARTMLLGSDHSIARIAAETGFSDQSHLTRSFRRWLGVSPARLRSLHGRVSRVQDETR